MPFFFLSHKRLRALCAGVCIAPFMALWVAPVRAQTAGAPDENIAAVTEREAILKCIQSLPPAPYSRDSRDWPQKNSAISPKPLESSQSAPPLPVAPVAPVATPAVLPAAPSESLRAAVTRLKLPLPLPAPRVVIGKAARTLELFSGSVLVKTYRVALGSNPSGHKQNQGDGRTPEGQFYICTRNNKDSAFHIFLGLSYPALPDATRAVNQKIITWRDYQIIRQRLASRGAPLWGTRLGGWVGIHGGSNGTFAARKNRERRSADWTAGCIGLTDKEISEIHAATILGTPVLIRP